MAFQAANDTTQLFESLSCSLPCTRSLPLHSPDGVRDRPGQYLCHHLRSLETHNQDVLFFYFWTNCKGCVYKCTTWVPVSIKNSLLSVLFTLEASQRLCVITGTDGRGQTCAEILGPDFCKKDGVLLRPVSATGQRMRAALRKGLVVAHWRAWASLYVMVPIIGDRDTRKQKDWLDFSLWVFLAFPSRWSGSFWSCLGISRESWIIHPYSPSETRYEPFQKWL